MGEVTFHLDGGKMRSLLAQCREEGLAEVYEGLEKVLPWKPASSTLAGYLTGDLDGAE